MAKTTATGGGKGDRARSPMPPAGGPRTPMRRFVRESWGELRKVQWPSRTQVAQGTLVVGIVTVFFAVYLTLLDYGMVRLVAQLEDWITG